MIRIGFAVASIAMAFGLVDAGYIVEVDLFGFHVWADMYFGLGGFEIVEWGT